MNRPLSSLQQRLGYLFNDPRLLEEALTHSSHASGSNERLELLGDAVLGFVITEELFNRFKSAREGKLTRLRARLVRGQTLSELAREFELGDYLRLGPGELKSGGFRRDSILADAMEAVIGAIYLEAGFEECRHHLLNWFESRLSQLSLDDPQKDPKTRLQEYLQARHQPLPDYRVVRVEGKAHAQTFHVECHHVLLAEPALGSGNSRRLAEQLAASIALKQLEATEA